ncbi:hypothetical protein GP486_006429 [Trichoglossum hirsutum]|uniref:Uncharacterized protein n=1 Tax=Trichoglossum hirsutum TaxID=265104 RepID=A0A9P8IJ50_9PEZI|nr:hypothetical protein GP486_006429 [Trichoglossum hirsutum]
MAIYGGIASPYPTALYGYHLFLMGRGETTREYLMSQKLMKMDRHRPFTHGNAIKNWMVVLCRPRPPTYLHFKKRYEEGDQRFGHNLAKSGDPTAMEHKNGGVELGALGKTNKERLQNTLGGEDDANGHQKRGSSPT